MVWKVEKKALIEYNHNMLTAHVIFPLLQLDIFKFEEVMLFMGKDFSLIYYGKQTLNISLVTYFILA